MSRAKKTKAKEKNGGKENNDMDLSPPPTARNGKKFSESDTSMEIDVEFLTPEKLMQDISPDMHHRSPDTYQRSPDTYQRSPDTYHRSPDRHHRSPDMHHRSPDTYQSSPDTYQRAGDVGQRSPGIGHHRKDETPSSESTHYRHSPTNVTQRSNIAGTYTTPEKAGDKSHTKLPRCDSPSSTSKSRKNRKATYADSSGMKKSSHHFHIICGTCLVLLVLIGIMLGSHVGGGVTRQPKTQHSATQLETEFRKKFTEMQRLYPEMSPRFWSVCGTAIQSVIKNPSPTQPAVVMVAIPPGRQSNTIASQLSKTYPSDTEPISINSTDFKLEDANIVKYKVDTLLERGFQRGSKAAVIHRLEELPPPVILIFYKYCDNENAPFKDSVIIFTVQLPYELNKNLSRKQQEEKVEEFLLSKWEQHEDLDKDKLVALFSRIGNSIAIIDS